MAKKSVEKKEKKKDEEKKVNTILPYYQSVEIQTSISYHDEYPCPFFVKGGYCKGSKIFCRYTDGDGLYHPKADCSIRDYLHGTYIDIFINMNYIPLFDRDDKFV